MLCAQARANLLGMLAVARRDMGVSQERGGGPKNPRHILGLRGIMGSLSRIVLFEKLPYPYESP